jgi:hypothetical protein
MSDINLTTFPENKYSALALLYLEQTGVGDLSPEELLDKYEAVRQRMREHTANKRSNPGLVTF